MSNEIVFILILVLFVVFLGIKSVIKKDFCVICVSVSLTWLLMLVARFMEKQVDQTLLAVLLGGSMVGLYYLIDARVGLKWKIFRMPFYLTLIFLALLVLDIASFSYRVLIIIFAVWIVFGLVFIFREFSRVKRLAQQIISCCKNW